MINQENIEKIFDVYKEAATFLFENFKVRYLDSIFQISENILDRNTIDMDLEQEKKYVKILNKLNKSYNVEEMRKGLSYVILSALRESDSTCGITPDGIVMIMNYLVDKLFGNKKLSILDPCTGTSNLLLGIAANRENEGVYGIDDDELMIKISMMMGNMVLPITLFNQDTFQVRLSNMDLVVSDVPKDIKFSYDLIDYHLDSLKDDGIMLVLINTEFFTNIIQDKKESINAKSKMLGIIELPDSFFKSDKKCIVIIKKTKEPIKNFLMASMPDVSNQNAMHEFLNKIELWFIQNGGN